VDAILTLDCRGCLAPRHEFYSHFVPSPKSLPTRSSNVNTMHFFSAQMPAKAFLKCQRSNVQLLNAPAGKEGSNHALKRQSSGVCGSKPLPHELAP
jgi:hypothetical protein